MKLISGFDLDMKLIDGLDLDMKLISNMIDIVFRS